MFVLISVLSFQKLFVAALGTEHLYHIANNRCRRIECPTVHALRQRKVSEEVFINFTEYINLVVFGNIFKNSDDIREQFRFFFRNKLSIHFLWQNAEHSRVFVLNLFHCFLHNGGCCRVIGCVVDIIIVGSRHIREDKSHNAQLRFPSLTNPVRQRHFILSPVQFHQTAGCQRIAGRLFPTRRKSS